MSFINPVPVGRELESLGNHRHEPAPKRRKLDTELSRKQGKVSTSLQRHRFVVTGYQRSSLDSQQQVATRSAKPACAKWKATKGSRVAINELRLPKFVEPSLHEYCRRFYHPKNRRKDSIRTRPHPEAEALTQPATINNQLWSGPLGYIFDGLRLTAQERDLVEELVSPNIVMGAQSLASSAGHNPTPTEICNQFRLGPFGYIFDGLRLTDQEQGLVEELISVGVNTDEVLSQNCKVFDVEETDAAVLQRLFPDLGYLTSIVSNPQSSVQ